MKPFPMPGDKIDERTVVASVIYFDDERGAIATVLLLNPKAPYFTVAHYALTHVAGGVPKAWGYNSADSVLPSYTEGEVDEIGTFENIVPAVREYEQSGGDY